jgi:hypothetical protein
VRATSDLASSCGLLLLATATSVSAAQAQPTVVAAAKAEDGPTVASLIARGGTSTLPSQTVRLRCTGQATGMPWTQLRGCSTPELTSMPRTTTG